jgi:hypothetical protein
MAFSLLDLIFQAQNFSAFLAHHEACQWGLKQQGVSPSFLLPMLVKFVNKVLASKMFG